MNTVKMVIKCSTEESHSVVLSTLVVLALYHDSSVLFGR